MIAETEGLYLFSWNYYRYFLIWITDLDLFLELVALVKSVKNSGLLQSLGLPYQIF